MRIRYTPESRDDLEAIYRYLDRRAPAAAQAVKAAIVLQIRHLADTPPMAPASDEPGIRELTIRRYPYKVYYSVDANEVWKLHIRHTSRRPPDLSEL
jgi:toxin ParE1/3/4